MSGRGSGSVGKGRRNRSGQQSDEVWFQTADCIAARQPRHAVTLSNTVA